MDIVMITRDRPELTEQCIRSMRENASSWNRHRLVVVFDGTSAEYEAYMDSYDIPAKLREHFGDGPTNTRYMSTEQQVGVGGAKNLGAQWFSNQFDHEVGHTPGPDSLLMFSDNDMWYGPGWDTRLETAYAGTSTAQIVQLGGWRHPFHKLGFRVDKLDPHIGRTYEVDAVTGNCFVIRWADWLRYGPFDSNAIGPGQSEDFALSQRIRAGGGLVATLDPPVAIHCGLVNSVGEPATGWRECEAQITEQLAGLSAEMRDSVLIMRPAPDSVVPRLSKMRRMGLDPAFADETFAALRERLNMEPRQPSVTATELDAYGLGSGFSPTDTSKPYGLNVGSGQRRFTSTAQLQWINIDSQFEAPDRVPDLVWEVGKEPIPFADNTAQCATLIHQIEHVGCGEAEPALRDLYRVLVPGGSLIVVLPDMRALASAWLTGRINEYIFNVNTYGAFMGHESDRHRWSYGYDSLREFLLKCSNWSTIDVFNYREIPGADIPRDWWMLAVEARK